MATKKLLETLTQRYISGSEGTPTSYLPRLRWPLTQVNVAVQARAYFRRRIPCDDEFGFLTSVTSDRFNPR